MSPILRLSLLALIAGCAPKAPTEPAAAPASAASTTDPATPTTAPKPAKQEPLYKLVNEAAALLDDDVEPAEIQRAIALLEQARGREPADATIRLDLGVARHRLGDLAGAQREYQAALGQDPSLGQAWLNQGRILLDQGRRSEAESTWRAGIRKAPEEMALRVALVDLLRTTGRTREALDEAKASLGENANSVEVYNAMGLCYQDLGDLVMARFVYQKALAGIPGANENAWLHLNLGWTYYLDAKTPLAVQELERALELDPYLVPALVNLARIYMDDHNYGDTVPLLERALSRAPDDAGVHMNLGIAYRGVGRYEEAEKQYREVMKLDPGDPSPWFNLGILFGDFTKDYDQSVSAFQQYLTSGGPDVERAEDYISLVEREKKRVEKRKNADQERKRREAERAAEKKLLEEEAKKNKGKQKPEESPETPHDGGGGDSPWGGGE